jgi:hypothetical protein
MAFDRNALRQGCQASAERTVANVDATAGFSNYVKQNTGRRIFRKIPEGNFIFDIIPYQVGKDFNTLFTRGSVQHNLDVWTHKDVGPTNDTVICPAATFGERCPICEEMERRRAANEDWEERIKPLRPRRRCLYNVWIHDAARTEEAHGVQLLEMAHFSLEKNIADIVRDPITGKFTPFADPDEGKTICFIRTGTGARNTSYSGFRFLNRTQPIPDAILEQAIDLTTAVEVLSYEELASKFYGGATAATPEEPSPMGSPFPEEAADDNTPPWELAPETPESVAPVRRATRPAPEPASEVATETPSDNPCPAAEFGGVYGESVDKFKLCNTCSLYDGCAEKFDATH